jgi:hypothetical protein
VTGRSQAWQSPCGAASESEAEWAIVQVQLEETRLVPVTIRIGDHEYAAPTSLEIPWPNRLERRPERKERIMPDSHPASMIMPLFGDLFAALS